MPDLGTRHVWSRRPSRSLVLSKFSAPIFDRQIQFICDQNINRQLLALIKNLLGFIYKFNKLCFYKFIDWVFLLLTFARYDPVA